jgi:hypothetical protein
MTPELEEKLAKINSEQRAGVREMLAQAKDEITLQQLCTGIGALLAAAEKHEDLSKFFAFAAAITGAAYTGLLIIKEEKKDAGGPDKPQA